MMNAKCRSDVLRKLFITAALCIHHFFLLYSLVLVRAANAVTETWCDIWLTPVEEVI